MKVLGVALLALFFGWAHVSWPGMIAGLILLAIYAIAVEQSLTLRALAMAKEAKSGR